MWNEKLTKRLRNQTEGDINYARDCVDTSY